MKLANWIVTVMFGVCALASGSAWAADSIQIGPLDRVLGKADAPLTVIEYASMTCPHCAKFHENVMPTIKADWIDTGKIKLVYRDLPTPPISMAMGVAMITQCAPKEQYFPILGYLFKAQDRWLSSPDPLSEIKRTVGLAGITPAEVDACLKNTDLSNQLNERAQEGTRLYHVNSTPTLVVNGQLIEGETPYASIKKTLEDAYVAAVKK